MSSSARDLHIRREKGQALVRALHLSELQAAGTTRELALREAETQLDRIARLLPDALGSGISIAEVARITKVSRPTLYELRGRYSADRRDVTFAVLQTIMGRGPIDTGGVAEHLERPRDEIASVVKELMDRGEVDEDLNEDEPMMELFVTERGFDRVEAWDFDDTAGDQEPGPR
jgi:hypothetical protein